MREKVSVRGSTSLLASVVLAGILLTSGASASGVDCGDITPAATPVFSDPVLLDNDLAGGEPWVQPTVGDGLLYSAHAGTTQLYKPLNGSTPAAEDWAKTYTGSINTWFSPDGGSTWDAVPLTERVSGAPLPVGFSDPAAAVDAAGNVYLSAIDALNVWVGDSADGRAFTGNHFSSLNMDRQWLAADTEGVVYMSATPMFVPWPNPRETSVEGFQQGKGVDPTSSRVLWRSTNGAKSWEEPFGVELPGSGSMSPILVNPIDGALYWPATPGQGSYTEVYVWRNARQGDLSNPQRTRVFGLSNAGGHFAASAVDTAGNYYTAWNSRTSVGYVYSTDGGASFERVTVASSAGQIIWPWIAAGSNGRVALAWLESSQAPLTGGDWTLKVAVSETAAGWSDDCGNHKSPQFTIAKMVDEPVHNGFICEQGLGCNLSSSASGDRRLGDYFTIAIDNQGAIVAGYGDTSQFPNDPVSHPAFVRQVGGVNLRG